MSEFGPASLTSYLLVAVVLFVAGVLAVATRRNAIGVLIGLYGLGYFSPEEKAKADAEREAKKKAKDAAAAAAKAKAAADAKAAAAAAPAPPAAPPPAGGTAT